MYQLALQGNKKAWKLELINTQHSQQLEHPRKDLEWLNEAKKMYQQALQGNGTSWGPEHTLTLNTVNNLGLLYKNL